MLLVCVLLEIRIIFASTACVLYIIFVWAGDIIVYSAAIIFSTGSIMIPILVGIFWWLGGCFCVAVSEVVLLLFLFRWQIFCFTISACDFICSFPSVLDISPYCWFWLFTDCAIQLEYGKFWMFGYDCNLSEWKNYCNLIHEVSPKDSNTQSQLHQDMVPQTNNSNGSQKIWQNFQSWIQTH